MATSGEIDLLETRGNANYTCGKKPYGRQRAAPTIHFGPDRTGKVQASWPKTNASNDYSSGFHKYVVEWNEDGFRFYYDDFMVGQIQPPDGGFWEYGKFSGNNLWANGTKMAPFDEEFYLIVNVAVGGNYFPDKCSNEFGDKPWSGYSVNGSMRSFWEARDDWLPTWRLETDSAAMVVDYIKIWSL